MIGGERAATGGFLELRCGAALGSVRVLNRLLEVALEALGVEDALRHDVTLGVAELVANVCQHETAGQGEAEVAVRLEVADERLELTLTSPGPAFDLAAAIARAEARDPLLELAPGGLGLPLLGALFDQVESSHAPGLGNRVVLRRRR